MQIGNADGAADSQKSTIQQISDFMQRLSLEATRPSSSDIADLKQNLKTHSFVYLTMLPGQDLAEFVNFAKEVRDAGFIPVPHIAVRHIASMDDFSSLLGRLRDTASVNRILLIGGDTPNAKGSVQSVLSVIESGVLQQQGLAHVGIAGFPDGHPILSDEELEANLLTKLAALQRCDISGHIVTQFCFDSETLIDWIGWLRSRGIDVPVRAGLAGPTSLMKWLNYARRCGVKASTSALVSQSGLVKKVFKSVAPDPIITRLANACDNNALGDVSPHLFSFGGIGATAKWALPATKGIIVLNGEGGFEAM